VAKITVSAKVILADVKAGMYESYLMEKYRLTEQGPQIVF
jgi:hypothetical protein